MGKDVEYGKSGVNNNLSLLTYFRAIGLAFAGKRADVMAKASVPAKADRLRQMQVPLIVPLNTDVTSYRFLTRT
jgi:hypothetical protein